MKLAIRRSTTMSGVFIAIAISVVAVLLFLQFTQKTGALEGEGRLITIYDRGEEKVLLSTGETIGDALTDAGVALEENTNSCDQGVEELGQCRQRGRGLGPRTKTIRN